MQKIVGIILLFSSFLCAMDNKQLLIRQLMRGREDNQHEYSQAIVFRKSPETFANQGTIHTINNECWQEIMNGNFIYVPCYRIDSDFKEQILKPVKAVIVGTTDPEDKKILENIFLGHSRQTIFNAHPMVIFNTIKNSVEPKEKPKKIGGTRARL